MTNAERSAHSNAARRLRARGISNMKDSLGDRWLSHPGGSFVERAKRAIDATKRDGSALSAHAVY